jgi:hypothetical protein
VDFLWRKRGGFFMVAVVLSICGGFWSLCARKARRKRERNLRKKDQKLQDRNGTKLVLTCRG